MSVAKWLPPFADFRYDKAAADFEQARAVDPDNPTLIVNYSRLHEIECIILCAAGEEPY